MRVRLRTCSGLLSGLIRAREGICMPFTPDHAEIVVPEGYLGAHYQDGIRIRPFGYDAHQIKVLPDGRRCDLILDVPLPDEAAAEKYARDRIGEPYDWKAIIGFLVPVGWHAHSPLNAICSAFVTMALRTGLFFPFPLAVPAHTVSPRDLMLVLSSHMAIDK